MTMTIQTSAYEQAGRFMMNLARWNSWVTVQRFGHRWCPPGVRPPWIVADQYQWRWLYLAVDPGTGASFALLLPGTDRRCLEVFLDAFAADHAADRIGLVLDNGGAHLSHELRWPATLVPLSLPAYSPELNPVERVFQALRARLAIHIIADLDELDDVITQVLREYWRDPDILKQLTGYPWWLDGIDAIQTSAP